MQQRFQRSGLTDNRTLLLALSIGAAAAYVGYSVARSSAQNRVAVRPDDDAPARTGRDHPVTGRTITINRPRAELFAFWADFTKLSQFMQSVSNVAMEDDVARWDIVGTLGRTVTLRTRMTDRREDEYLAWESTDNSDVQAAGQIKFRDAPTGRGTELEAELTYRPPLGVVGNLMGQLFQTDPVRQGRIELRRFKMLMETGEIATNKNHKTPD